MGYVKNTWQSGDVVTAAKLNHIEDGIANAAISIRLTTEDEVFYTADKTWKEIYDAMAAGFGMNIYYVDIAETGVNVTMGHVISVYSDLQEEPQQRYAIEFVDIMHKGSDFYAYCTAETEYPVWFYGD